MANYKEKPSSINPYLFMSPVPTEKMKPILCIPHSGTDIPWQDEYSVFLPHVSTNGPVQWHFDPKIRKARHDRAVAIREEKRVMTDWYTDELFDNALCPVVKTEISRLICDVERFSDDEDEPMATKGMGFCYTHGSEGQKIKNVKETYKKEVLWRYYAPYHIAMLDEVDNSLLLHNQALIIDCHSFSSKPLSYEPNQDANRPDICVGTDEYHTPQELENKVVKFFKNKGYTVTVNSPYSGTIVPIQHYHTDKRVKSVMIELNRKLYMNEQTLEKNGHFKTLKGQLNELEEMLSE